MCRLAKWRKGVVRSGRAGAAGCIAAALLFLVGCSGNDKRTETSHQSGSAGSGSQEGRAGQADAMADRDSDLASDSMQEGSHSRGSEPRRPTGGSDRSRGSSVVDQPSVGRPR